MNIDEFIEHTKEKAREHRYHADFFESDNPMNTVCIKSAEDCEQLAGWLKKAEEYQQLEERLNKVYGDCDGLLLRVVEMLEKHPRIYMANNTLKSRLLTDEDVDKWEEYKLSDEQGRLIKLPCKVGDTVYHVVQGRIVEVSNVDLFFLLLSVAENRFNDSVFLTKTEAETKLKELGGGE